MPKIQWSLLHVACVMQFVAVFATPEECQPKGGIHRHQPQFHIIAPMFPGKNGTTWPGVLDYRRCQNHLQYCVVVLHLNFMEHTARGRGDGAAVQLLIYKRVTMKYAP